MNRLLAGSVIALTMAANAMQAAPVNGTGNVTPDVIFGSSNPNGAFTGVTGGGVELALRAKQRYDLAGMPTAIFNYDGGDTYTFSSATGVVPANRSIFNFEWAINTLTTGANALTYLISVDLDPTVNIGSLVNYDPLGLGGTGWYSGNNATANGSGVFLGDLTTNNVAQNSVNMGFSPISTPVRSGQYTITLAAFRAGASVGSTSINVIVDAPAPIPLPAALPLLVSALGGLGLFARRRRRAAV